MAVVYDKKKGIIMILLSALFFSMMNVFSRMAGDIPVMQKTFFRNFVTIFLVLFMLRKSGTPIHIKKGTLRDHILRSTFGIVSMVGNFYAVDHMMLSDSTMILELSPFFAILLSVFILREKPGAKQLVCVFIALFGAVFVVKPTLALFTSGGPAAIALGASMLSGAAYTMVRKLTTAGENGKIVILFFSAFSCLFCLPSLILDYTPFTGFQFLMLMGTAVAGCCAQFSVTAAYTHAPAAEISFYDYSQLFFAAIFGWIFFDQMADKWSYIGYGIILVAAVIMFMQGRHKVNK